MARASRWIAIWHIILLVTIHCMWLLSCYLAGAAPTGQESWGMPPLSWFPTAYGVSVGAIIVTMYGGPFTVALSIVQALRAPSRERIACAAIVVSALVALWLDPTGAVNWYVD